MEESRLGEKIIKRREVNRDKRIMWGGEGKEKEGRRWKWKEEEGQ